MPVPVPDDEVIDVELELDFELDPSDLTSLEPGRGEGESGEAARISGNPDRPPSVVRIVEATARQFVPEQYRGQLEIIVNFLVDEDRKSTRLNSSHVAISYAVFCLKKKKDRC